MYFGTRFILAELLTNYFDTTMQFQRFFFCFALPSICNQTRCVLFHGCVCSFRRRYVPVRYAAIRSILEHTQFDSKLRFS